MATNTSEESLIEEEEQQQQQQQEQRPEHQQEQRQETEQESEQEQEQQQEGQEQRSRRSNRHLLDKLSELLEENRKMKTLYARKMQLCENEAEKAECLENLEQWRNECERKTNILVYEIKDWLLEYLEGKSPLLAEQFRREISAAQTSAEVDAIIWNTVEEWKRDVQYQGPIDVETGLLPSTDSSDED